MEDTLLDSRPQSRAPESPTRPARSSLRQPSGLEQLLRRIGGWAKRLAFASQVNRVLGPLSDTKAIAIYTTATFVSVWKVLHDVQEPYGSRRYIANLAGDDDAIELLRSNQPNGPDAPSCIPWARMHRDIMGKKRTVLSKAIGAGTYVVYRNRFTLSVFWGLTLVRRLMAYTMAGKRRRPLLATLFPAGLSQYFLSCSRTAGLLFTFPMCFWFLVGAAKAGNVGRGLDTRLATLLVTISAVLSMPVEDRKRWQAFAAFMSMSVFD